MRASEKLMQEVSELPTCSRINDDADSACVRCSNQVPNSCSTLQTGREGGREPGGAGLASARGKQTSLRGSALSASRHTRRPHTDCGVSTAAEAAAALDSRGARRLESPFVSSPARRRGAGLVRPPRTTPPHRRARHLALPCTPRTRRRATHVGALLPGMFGVACSEQAMREQEGRLPRRPGSARLFYLGVVKIEQRRQPPVEPSEQKVHDS